MKFETDKLVSVVVLVRRSGETISRALHSLFTQDYPRVEIIIADNGANRVSQKYVDDLVSYSAGDNIKRVEVVAGLENEGTVSSLRRALGVTKGEYFIIIDANDSLASNSVISDFMATFFYRAWKPLLVTGLVETWSENMDTPIGVMPEPEARAALQSEDPERLLNALAYECAVSIAATCFHRSFVGKIDAFDRSYMYCEDHPTFIRMAANGIAPAYLGKVAVKHFAERPESACLPKKVLGRMRRDRKRMWKVELKPHAKLLTKESLRRNRIWRQKEGRVNEEGFRGEKKPANHSMISNAM